MRWRSRQLEVERQRQQGYDTPPRRSRSVVRSVGGRTRKEGKEKKIRSREVFGPHSRSLGLPLYLALYLRFATFLLFNCSRFVTASLPSLPLSRLIRPGPSAASVSPCLASWQFLAALRVNKTVAASLAGLAHAGVTRTLT